MKPDTGQIHMSALEGGHFDNDSRMMAERNSQLMTKRNSRLHVNFVRMILCLFRNSYVVFFCFDASELKNASNIKEREL